jgi:hypothetical protein
MEEIVDPKQGVCPLKEMKFKAPVILQHRHRPLSQKVSKIKKTKALRIRSQQERIIIHQEWIASPNCQKSE